MSNISPDFRRLTDYLQLYWDSMKGVRQFPALDSIDVMALEENFRKDCFLLELVPTITRHNTKVLFMGENLGGEYRQDESGVAIKNLVVRFLELPMDHYDKVIESRRAVVQNVELPQAAGARIKYRQILLPIGPADDQPITAILGGMRYKKG